MFYVGFYVILPKIPRNFGGSTWVSKYWCYTFNQWTACCKYLV